MKQKSLQIINSIKTRIIKDNLVQTNQSIVLAISGGQDSIFLLITFFIIKKQFNLKIYIFYGNHLWEKNTFYLYFHLSKITFCLNKKLIYSITLKLLKTEEESRYWRSKNYYRLLDFLRYNKISTGHTLTDQLETFFFNITRGSSFNNSSSLKLKKSFDNFNQKDFFISQFDFKKLKKIFSLKKIYNPIGINYDKKNFSIIKKKSFELKMIRPLINETRFDTKNNCNNLKLPLIPDQSNQKINYSRNRLRKQFLPTFRLFFNPKMDYTISRNNIIIADQEDYINNLVLLLIKKLLKEDKNGYFFDLSFFCSLNLALQRKILFFFLKEKLKLNSNFSLVNSFINFFNNYLNIMKKKIYKTKKENNKKYIFFPEIGTIYLSTTLLIFLK